MPLINFNKQEEESTTVTHFLITNLRIYNHIEKEAFLFVISLSHYPIILGIPQLKLHNPELKFSKGTMLFNSPYCQNNCNTPLQITCIYAVPDVLLKERSKNVVHPVADSVPISNKLELYSVSLRAIGIYACYSLKVYQVSLKQVETAL